MDKKERRKILEDLLIQYNDLKPDLQKFQGNPVPALAERLIKFINVLTPYAHLFDNSFKTKIKNYILAYEGARTSTKSSDDLPKIIKPTSDLIKKAIEDEILKLK